MGMNRVQFQRGLSMAEFLEHYGTEKQCRTALVAARWPQGFRCPDCTHERHSTFVRQGRQYWQCQRCRHQTTVTAGTVFEATKLPLSRRFLAMHLMTQAKNNVSALELKRHLGLRYKSAWLMKHKLLQVMVEREARRVLEGRVEIDDAYLGGERPGKPGRSSENKIPFVVAVQTTDDGQPVVARMNRIAFTKDAIQAWAHTALAASAHVISELRHARIRGRRQHRSRRRWRRLLGGGWTRCRHSSPTGERKYHCARWHSLSLDTSATSGRFAVAVFLDYLRNMKQRKGRPARPCLGSESQRR